MARSVTIVVSAFAVLLLLQSGLVPATVGVAQEAPENESTVTEEEVDLTCLPLAIPLPETHLEATRLEADNLSMDSSTVKSTEDPQPAGNETFSVHTKRIEVDEVCLGELIDPVEWRTKLVLRGAEITNSTIEAPHTYVHFEEGYADSMTIYTPLPMSELLEPIIGGSSAPATTSPSSDDGGGESDDGGRGDGGDGDDGDDGSDGDNGSDGDDGSDGRDGNDGGDDGSDGDDGTDGGDGSDGRDGDDGSDGGDDDDGNDGGDDGNDGDDGDDDRNLLERGFFELIGMLDGDDGSNESGDDAGDDDSSSAPDGDANASDDGTEGSESGADGGA